MTTTTTDLTAAPSRTPLIAALGIAAASALTAVGTWWAVNDSAGTEHSASDWLITVVVIAVAAAIVFGLVVRTAAAGNPSRRALVLGLVGVLSVVVFWSGLPLVLVSAAVACALVDKDGRGSFGTSSKVALGLSVLATIAAVTLAVTG